MKKVFYSIGWGLVGLVILGIIIVSLLGYRFYKTNLRGMGDSGAREHLRILSDATKRGDYPALVAEYDKNRDFWQELETKNKMIAEANATFLSQAYEKVGRNKDAALQYFKLAQFAQQEGSKSAASYNIGKAAGLDPQNADVAALRTALGASIDRSYEIPNDPGNIRFALTSKGEMAIDETLCNAGTLIDTLREKLKDKPGARIVIYADADVPNKDVELAMTKARQAGAKHISVNSNQLRK